MQTFSMKSYEDAGDKFRLKDMTTSLTDWKKNNPGAAQKADQRRVEERTVGLKAGSSRKSILKVEKVKVKAKAKILVSLW